MLIKASSLRSKLDCFGAENFSKLVIDDGQVRADGLNMHLDAPCSFELLTDRPLSRGST